MPAIPPPSAQWCSAVVPVAATITVDSTSPESTTPGIFGCGSSSSGQILDMRASHFTVDMSSITGDGYITACLSIKVEQDMITRAITITCANGKKIYIDSNPTDTPEKPKVYGAWLQRRGIDTPPQQHLALWNGERY